MAADHEAEVFCKHNDPIAKYEIASNHILYIHGTVYDIENEVFYSEVFGNTKKYDRAIIHRAGRSGKFYILIDNTKYFLDTFSKP